MLLKEFKAVVFEKSILEYLDMPLPTETLDTVSNFFSEHNVRSNVQYFQKLNLFPQMEGFAMPKKS